MQICFSSLASGNCTLLNFSFIVIEIVQFMNAFNRAMNALDDKYSFLALTKQIVSSTSEDDKVQTTDAPG